MSLASRFTVLPVKRLQVSEFIETYHYLASTPGASYYFAAFDNATGHVVGAVTYSQGRGDKYFNTDPDGRNIELSRLVLRPVGVDGKNTKNLASYLMSQSMKILKECSDLRYIFTMSDPSLYSGSVYKSVGFTMLPLKASERTGKTTFDILLDGVPVKGRSITNVFSTFVEESESEKKKRGKHKPSVKILSLADIFARYGDRIKLVPAGQYKRVWIYRLWPKDKTAENKSRLTLQRTRREAYAAKVKRGEEAGLNLCEVIAQMQKATVKDYSKRKVGGAGGGHRMSAAIKTKTVETKRQGRDVSDAEAVGISKGTRKEATLITELAEKKEITRDQKELLLSMLTLSIFDRAKIQEAVAQSEDLSAFRNILSALGVKDVSPANIKQFFNALVPIEEQNFRKEVMAVRNLRDLAGASALLRLSQHSD